jgi:thioredoxin-like negative regulator of GroEL
MGLGSWIKNLSKPKVAPLHVTDATFKDVVEKSELPVLLDVWGPNCSWCVKLMPTIAELADKYDGAVRVADLNAAESPVAAGKLGVRGTPTVLLLRKGKIVERIVGFKPQAFLEQAMVVKFPDVFEADAPAN